jgi:hypothetical protein
MVIEITTSTARSLMKVKPQEEVDIYLSQLQRIVKDKRYGWYGVPDFSLVLDDSTPFEYLKGSGDDSECDHDNGYCECGDRVVMTTPESKAWMETFREQIGGYCTL